MIAYPEIFDLDLPICCEVKTKIDSTRQIAAKSVLNSLKDAKRQLPKDKPGVVFVRLVGSSEVQEIIDAVQSVEYAANEFLRSTKRVIAVCVVTHHVNDYASFHELRPFLKRVVNRDIGKL